jgi:uncharacterized protein YuzE
VVALAEMLPELVAELESSLVAGERGDLGSQLREVQVVRCTYDASCDAAYIYVQSPRIINAVEENIIGVRHGETIPVEHKYWVNVDTDNFGRLLGIELLRGGDVASRLSAFIALPLSP